MTSQMRIKTDYTDVTFEVNPGVAQTMTSLIRQHPQTRVVDEITHPHDDGTEDVATLRRQLREARRWRDRAEDRLNKVNCFIIGLREGIEMDKVAGVHPGSILRQVQDSLNDQRNDPDEYAETGYGTGMRTDTISSQRRREQRRRERAEAQAATMREVANGINNAAQTYTMRMSDATYRFTQLATHMEAATNNITASGWVAPAWTEVEVHPF